MGSMFRENSLPVRVLPMCWGSHRFGGGEGVGYLVQETGSVYQTGFLGLSLSYQAWLSTLLSSCLSRH